MNHGYFCWNINKRRHFLCLIGLDCKKNPNHIHSGQNTSLPKAATDFFKKVGHFVCQKTHGKP